MGTFTPFPDQSGTGHDGRSTDMGKGAAIIIGAGGGIGKVVADALEEEGEYAPVIRIARQGTAISIDLTDEASIIAAVAALPEGISPRLVLCATGLLHRPERRPEKATAALDPIWMADNFAVNAIGPALIAKHFLPRMPRDGRSIFAALSARVGSISDNRTGGWHSYRASKAALNMFIRTIAIERTRQAPSSIVVALHPGTVDTPLSSPFQGNVAPGKLFPPDRAALQLLDVLDGLAPAQTGRLFAWDGEEIAP